MTKETQEIAVVEAKSLIQQLIPELPLSTSILDDARWYFLAHRTARKAKKLIHSDLKSCKKSQADLRKFAKWIADNRKREFAEKTAKIQKKANFFIKIEKKILEIADGYPVQFEAEQKAKIEAIKATFANALVLAWDERKVSPEFRKGVLPEPKESMLTEKGALTKSTKAAIDALAQADLMWQVEIENRTTKVELECRRAGIDTPFSAKFIGGVFYDQNRDVFESHLAELIAEEVSRKQEADRKAKEKLEAEHQAELDRQAREHERELTKARQAPKPELVPVIVPFAEPAPLPQVVTIQPVQQQTAPEPVKIAFKLPKSDKMLLPGDVVITVGFKFNLRRQMTEKQLTDWLESMTQDQIIEKFKEKIVSFEVVNELG